MNTEKTEAELVTEEGIRGALRLVNEFHEKVVGCPQELLENTGTLRHMSPVAVLLKEQAELLLEYHKTYGDQAYLRGHLITEETSEFHEALVTKDEVQVLDSLADLFYVVVGTALTMDLPLAEAFTEVHRSNMTKQRLASDADGMRVRQKGEGYRPPDLAKVLNDYRARQAAARAAAGTACTEA